MADLGITNSGSLNTGNFYYGSTPLHQFKETIAEGQTLSAGTILGKITATGELAGWNTDAEDGTATMYGVLLEDIDTTGGSAIASVGVLGQFITGGLTAFAGVTTITQIPAVDGVYKFGTLIFKSEE